MVAAFLQGINPNSFEPKSGAITSVLSQIKDAFETNLAKSQQKKAPNQQAHADLKFAKDSEIAAGTDQSGA